VPGVDLAGAGVLPSTNVGAGVTPTAVGGDISGDLAKVASTIDLKVFYLVLGGLALAAAISAGFLGLLGVRNRWAS
jgi:hypothetical protein